MAQSSLWSLSQFSEKIWAGLMSRGKPAIQHKVLHCRLLLAAVFHGNESHLIADGVLGRENVLHSF